MIQLAASSLPQINVHGIMYNGHTTGAFFSILTHLMKGNFVFIYAKDNISPIFNANWKRTMYKLSMQKKENKDLFPLLSVLEPWDRKRGEAPLVRKFRP